MRVLVTGGAGYIGSHTVLELLGQTHDVLIVDNFSNSNPVVVDRIKQLSNGNVEVENYNLLDTLALNKSFDGFRPDAVIHFAGLKIVGESTANPLAYYRENMQSTFSLLEAMERTACKSIVFSSSANIYGRPHYLPVDEAHPAAPTNPYGRTKYFIEEVLRDWAHAHSDAKVIALRYFNPVGAHASGLIGEDPSDVPTNIMPYISQVAVGRLEQVNVFGDDYETPDGTGIRDYLHVVDLATSHVAALDALAHIESFEAINVGTGTGTSVLELIHAFEKASGLSIPYRIAPRRENDMPSVYANVERAKTVLKWQSKFNVDDMCSSTWKWQKNNPNGYGG